MPEPGQAFAWAEADELWDPWGMNDEQIRLWNEQNAPRWLARRAEVTRAITPHGLAGISALAPAAGERALDVGCGCGDTTLDLARRVGPEGAVVGIDVCEPFLAAARAEAAGWPNITYVGADAQTHDFAEPFDLCFSRFGVMFFADPPTAFAKLRAGLRAGGRLALVVWGPVEVNEWAWLPLTVVRGHLDAPPPGPGPGPFSLADRNALGALLRGAGFAEVRTEPVEITYLAGESIAAAAELLLQFGPAAVALRQAGAAGEALRHRLEAKLAERLAGHGGPDGVRLRSVATVATGRA